MKKIFIVLAIFAIRSISASDESGSSDSGSASVPSYSALVTYSYSQAVRGGGGAKGSFVDGLTLNALAQNVATFCTPDALLIRGENTIKPGSSTLRSILINDIEGSNKNAKSSFSVSVILPAGTTDPDANDDTKSKSETPPISAFVTCAYTQAVSGGVSTQASSKQGSNMEDLLQGAIKYCTDESLITGENNTGLAGGKTLKSILMEDIMFAT